MAIESGKEEKGFEVKNISNEKLLEMVQEQQRQIQALLASQNKPTSTSGLTGDDLVKLVKAIKDTDSGIDKNWEDGIDESQIPLDDVLDKPVLFFSPCGGTCIVDDKRHGQRILLPFGRKKPIWFDNPAVKQIQHGKDVQLIVISTYVCKSKKEAEWLRKHTLFGTKFFESIEQTVSKDVVKAQRLSTTMTIVQQYSPHDLLKHAKSYGVEIGTDYDKMRFRLAEAMVEAEENREYISQREALLTSEKDRLVYKDHIEGKGA